MIAELVQSCRQVCAQTLWSEVRHEKGRLEPYVNGKVLV